MKFKKWIFFSLILIIAFIISFYGYGYYKKIKAQKKEKLFYKKVLQKARIFTVSQSSIPDYIEIDDEVEPKEIKDLSFPISGIIKKIYVNEGDYVKKGQIIARLDTSSIELNILQTEKNIKNAIVNGSSQLDIEIYKKQKQIYEEQLNQCYLKAPYSCYISNLYKSDGDIVSSGQTIAQIYDLSYLISIVWIDETEIKKIKIGNNVEVNFNYNEKKKYFGKVSNIYKNYQIVDGVVSYPVEIKFDNLPEEINPGFTFSGKIYYGKKNNKLIVPLTAVSKDQKGYFVAKILNNTLIKKYVQIGDVSDKYYEITNGLKEGDKILFLNLLGYSKANKNNIKFNPFGKKRNPPPGPGK